MVAVASAGPVIVVETLMISAISRLAFSTT
jgi:hypothetical protein